MTDGREVCGQLGHGVFRDGHQVVPDGWRVNALFENDKKPSTAASMTCSSCDKVMVIVFTASRG